ncbi:FliH/SctL family protein [Paenibacillus daejeonensis]|uniref:FliH/SctL family protein n=1 Tax=Paenibacillus daejeonensis TaxID=135193 RepID=UPI00037B6610|nr:FliH/SctL family protein [Paenibacillus daejeonensis]
MSNLIKSTHVIPLEELKRLQWEDRYAALYQPPVQEAQTAAGPDAETLSLRDQIISDAEDFAEERIRQSAETAEQQLAEAQETIEQWWEGRRSSDAQVIEEARQSGAEQGYQEGYEQAKADIEAQWQGIMAEANQMLEHAYKMRESIIQEAEPFVVELSCAIAEKVIGHQLENSPELALQLIRKSLSRRREQGVITLCVSPGQLAFVQAAREELALVIDSQAELRILPDASVKDKGCVIRSSFGSIDARIDTQLEEIKRELSQLALHSEETEDDDAAGL